MICGNLHMDEPKLDVDDDFVTSFEPDRGRLEPEIDCDDTKWENEICGGCCWMKIGRFYANGKKLPRSEWKQSPK